MNHSRIPLLHVLFTLLLVGGCATRPINAPITEAGLYKGYQYLVRDQNAQDQENVVILAFSGGGTRAAAFSYGVLETLRRTEVVGPGGTARLMSKLRIQSAVA